MTARNVGLAFALFLTACGPSRPRASSFSGPDTEALPAFALAASGRSAAYSAVTGMAARADGSAVIVGNFGGTIQLDNHTVTSAGASDGFVAKVAPTGTIEWVRHFGSKSADAATAVTLSATGRIAIAGTFHGAITLGATRLSATNNEGQAFIALLEPGGAVLWARQLSASRHVRIAELAFAPDGSLVAVGYFSGALAAGSHQVTSAGGQDAVVLGLAADGTVRWLKRAGGTAADHANALHVSTDRIYVAGAFAGSADFAGAVLRSNRNQDGFLAALNLDGSVEWVNTFGGSDRDIALTVTRRGQQITVAGVFTGNDANFGGENLQAGDDNLAGFVSSYDLKGEPLWSTRIGDGAVDARSVSSRGNTLILGGTYAGEQRLAGRNFGGRGARGGFAAALSSDGEVQWAIELLTTGDLDIAAVRTTGARSVLVAGSFSGEMNVGKQTLRAKATMPMAFIARIERPQ